ncbi:hypothetical protein ACQPVA_00780 [Clostridium butyricum]|uniref:hypothetical protein n=1 Tax=Clostridium butyricum TaxID=1492 RepID=UPI003D33B014
MSKKLCPKCGSEKIIPILYGYPTKEMFEDSDNDECILGGCCIASTEEVENLLNKYHCRECGFEWK